MSSCYWACRRSQLRSMPSNAHNYQGSAPRLLSQAFLPSCRIEIKQQRGFKRTCYPWQKWSFACLRTAATLTLKTSICLTHLTVFMFFVVEFFCLFVLSYFFGYGFTSLSPQTWFAYRLFTHKCTMKYHQGMMGILSSRNAQLFISTSEDSHKVNTFAHHNLVFCLYSSDIYQFVSC